MAPLSQNHGIDDFVLISIDNAVRRTNVAAIKQVSDVILQSMVTEVSNTHFFMTRFGNAFGFSGSFVPLCRKRIAAGGSVTVTHEAITLYFMTLPEVAQLVVQAGGVAQGGEVFVLDMGELVKVVDLAQRMIELSGLSLRDESNPSGGIEIKVIGLRPADKLNEELLIGGNPETTSQDRILKAHDGHLDLDKLHITPLQLEDLVRSSNFDALRQQIHDIVPEFNSGPPQ